VNLIAFLYGTLILFSMSIMPLFMKQLSSSLLGMQVLFVISLILTIVSLGIIYFRGEFVSTFDVIFTKSNIGVLILLIAFLMFLDTWPYIKALQQGADVGILLSYVRAGGTVFTALLGVYFLDEKLTPVQWAGIVFCVVGIALILLFKAPETQQ